MGSAGSAAPRKFEGKSSFGRKYWSFEEMHRKFENDNIRKYFWKEQKAGNIGLTIPGCLYIHKWNLSWIPVKNMSCLGKIQTSWTPLFIANEETFLQDSIHLISSASNTSLSSSKRSSNIHLSCLFCKVACNPCILCFLRSYINVSVEPSSLSLWCFH